ncbi:MAG: YihY family inner membrane protein [Deltaproteobacteria bacterium]|nr:YihY family inner membrane protein [Deltaproteobacteria bacterium]
MANRLANVVNAARELTRALVDHDPMAEVSRVRRIVGRYVRMTFLTARWEVYDNIKLHAQALTYDTLLAIVPLLAVIFAIFKGFGGTDEIGRKIQLKIMESVAGSPELQATVQGYMEQFIGNVSAGQIGTVSVVLLIYSVLSLLGHIEVAFNAIFGATAQRPIVTRMLTYWAVLTFGPLLLLASFGLTAALQTTKVGALVDQLSVVSSALVWGVPLFITWVGFASMYLFVPNTRVRIGAALFAAVVAGSGWNLAKYGYAVYAKNAITLQNIYGSLAVIPLFVFWLYVSWLIVLFGAQLAFAFQNAKTYRREDELARASQRFLERAACRLLAEVAADFIAGRPPTDPEQLAATLSMPRRMLEILLTRLKTSGLLCTTEPDGRLLPAHDPAKTTLNDVIEVMQSAAGVEPLFVADATRQAIDLLFARLDAERVKIMDGVSLKDLVAKVQDERQNGNAGACG